MKCKFTKLPPKKIMYRDYSKLNPENYINEIKNEIPNEEIHMGILNNFFVDIMNKHAPLKTKMVRRNNKAHVTKELRKVIMTRFRLKNIYNKTKNIADFDSFKKQRNHVVSLNKRFKKLYFKKIDINKRNNEIIQTIYGTIYCKPIFLEQIYKLGLNHFPDRK